ncbi:histidine phosphatase family protein [Sphingobacterium faecale]|uniref:Histidine phosphatase family protein n=1 Tax=Sphingobacterium faecale TaxID=2803775 RepID=A0ABS1R714_9SPHI|nr:histidine phosphatase family protein [Sphingobacterium faecale]MBL1410448.1 histidine phosphatase family protein [Sphingobacterium faecale]
MVTICLLRHGETGYNADGNKYCGRTDIDLTERGIAQAFRMKDLLADFEFDAVFSSPLKRAKNTAAIASGKGQETVLDSRLIEVDFGEWEGKRPEEFQKEDPQSWDNWLSAPDEYRAGNTGETAKEVIARLDSFYNELLDQYDGRTVLIVGHNGVNRFFMASQLGMPLKNYRKIVQENSALTLFTLSKEQGISLLKLNA